MDDRDWLDERALAVIDNALHHGARAAFDSWKFADRPLLSARARAIIEAVEHVLARYCPWRCGQLGTDEFVCHGKWTECEEHGPDCGIDCPLAPIRRAYLGTTPAAQPGAMMGVTAVAAAPEIRFGEPYILFTDGVTTGAPAPARTCGTCTEYEDRGQRGWCPHEGMVQPSEHACIEDHWTPREGKERITR